MKHRFSYYTHETVGLVQTQDAHLYILKDLETKV